jgi:hypothetical protein
MSATIRVEQCLANQSAIYAARPGVIGELHKYPGCKNCSQGERAARGELSDGDVLELIRDAKGECDMENNNGYNTHLIPDTHICIDCDQDFDEWILGSKAPMTKRCKPCHYARAGKIISQAMRKQREDFESDTFRVMLDFNKHRGLFSSLEGLAKLRFRNLDQQIMYMLDSHGWEDE